jgi:glucuronate isomerase
VASFHADDAELFRAQMLTEMARMSVDDGLVMQIHPGSFRNHNRRALRSTAATRAPTFRCPPIMSAPEAAAGPLRQRADLTIILFTLDETAYSRELAPLAGHYPA